MGSKKNWKKFKKAAAKFYGKQGNMLPEFMDYIDPCGDSTGSIHDLVMSQDKMSIPYPNGMYRNPSDGRIVGSFSPRINPVSSADQIDNIKMNPQAVEESNEMISMMQFNSDLGFIHNDDPTIKEQYEKGNIRDIVTRSGDDIFCRVSPYIDIRSTIDIGDQEDALTVGGYFDGESMNDIDIVTNILTYAMIHQTGYSLTGDEEVNTMESYVELLHRYIAALGYIYQHLDQCEPSVLLDKGIIVSTVAELRVWTQCLHNAGILFDHREALLSGAYYFNDKGCYKYSGISNPLAAYDSEMAKFMYMNPSIDGSRLLPVRPYAALRIPSTGKMMIVYVMNRDTCYNIIQMASDLYTKNNPRPVNTVTSSAVPPVEN